MDANRARESMVNGQVRTNDVTHPRLIAALRALPRERFVPADRAPLAYAELEIEVAPGRRLMRLRDLAKLLQALDPQPQDRALEIAGATGYGAAVLALMTHAVVAHDPDAALSLQARAAFDACGLANVACGSTECPLGWPDGAPYDVMLLNGSAEVVPQAWLSQLADGGRLGVIVRDGAAGAARVYTRSGESVAYRTVFDASPPLAPGLARPKRFAL